MEHAKNVVFFVTSLQSGGLENYLLRFLKEKHLSFDRVTIFCKGGIGGQLESEYLALSNVTIVKKQLGFFNVLAYFQLRQFLSQGNFDAVCDFTGNFAGLILKIAKEVGIPKRIVFYRGSSDHFTLSFVKSRYNNWVKELVFKHATDILANSRAGFEFFFPKRWENDDRFEVIYNGINAESFISETDNLRREFNIPEKAFVVGHTGRYNSAKNHKTILQVAEELVRDFPDIYFILCGNKVKQNLESLLIEKQLNHRILTFENRSDIPIFLNTMDCYYFPSVTEGQPNALIEAMLMNITVVASDIDSIKETVPKEFHNYLVPPLDKKAAKEKILEVYHSKVQQNLREWTIQNFDSEKLFNQFYIHF